MMYQAIIFDLDGTLADTLADLANAVNHALTSLGQAALTGVQCRELVGHGVVALMTKAIKSPPPEQLDRAVELFRRHYAQHMLDNTGPYDGIGDMLDGLVDRGLTLGVLSNKPHDATVAIVAHAFARWAFGEVAGQKPDVPMKPDPTSALAMAGQMDIAPARCVYVGDSDVDMLTGKAAGFLSVGVTWGFRSEASLRSAGADAIIHHPSELLSCME